MHIFDLIDVYPQFVPYIIINDIAPFNQIVRLAQTCTKLNQYFHTIKAYSLLCQYHIKKAHITIFVHHGILYSNQYEEQMFRKIYAFQKRKMNFITAATSGCYVLIDLFIDQQKYYIENNIIKPDLIIMLLEKAISFSNIKLIKQLLQFKFDNDNNFKIINSIISSIAIFNRSNILDCIQNNDFDIGTSIFLAIKYKNIKLLDWIYNQIKDNLDNLKYFDLSLNYLLKITEELKKNYHYIISWQIELLEWWRKSGLPLDYTEDVIDGASRSKQIELLEWWRNSGLELKYTEATIDEAVLDYDRHNVINWWIHSGLPLKYTETAIDYAAYYDNIELFKHLFYSGLELKYTEKSIDNASFCSNIALLELWRNSGLELKYTEAAMNEVQKVCVLNWWLNSGLELKYTEKSMDNSLDIEMLDWWLKSGLELKYSEAAMDTTNNIRRLNWWLNSGLKLKYTEKAMDNASNTDILDWWLKSGLELKYTEKAMDKTYSTKILDWWLKSGLELKYTEAAIENAKNRSDPSIVAFKKAPQN